MTGKRNRIVGSIIQGLVFLILAAFVLGYELFSLRDLTPILIIIAIGLVIIFSLRKRSFSKRKK